MAFSTRAASQELRRGKRERSWYSWTCRRGWCCRFSAAAPVMSRCNRSAHQCHDIVDRTGLKRPVGTLDRRFDRAGWFQTRVRFPFALPMKSDKCFEEVQVGDWYAPQLPGRSGGNPQPPAEFFAGHPNARDAHASIRPVGPRPGWLLSTTEHHPCRNRIRGAGRGIALQRESIRAAS